MPETMRAIEITRPGGPEVLAIADLPLPKPGPGEVLIRVAAAGINHADLMQREGNYPPPAGVSPILGMEAAGTIVATGAEAPARRWRAGDSVCALIAGGGYAEYCTAPAGQCLPIPEGLSPVEAASLPEAAITVWANLFEPRRVHAGDLVLIQGGSSGVGAMAIQIARQFGGARVAATAGSGDKCLFAQSMGAEIAVNYHGDWQAEIASWSAPHGIDAILDMVGGEYVQKHLALLAPQGRLVHIAFSGGRQATIDLSLVMRKRLSITGSTLRSRPLGEKAALAAAVEQNLWPLFSQKRLRPAVFQTFPLAQAADAHRLLESSRHMGKLILRIG